MIGKRSKGKWVQPGNATITDHRSNTWHHEEEILVHRQTHMHIKAKILSNPFMPNAFSILINWTSPFQILGLLGGIFHFYTNFTRNFCKQTVENLIRRFVESGLVLQCLPMSHKKDGR